MMESEAVISEWEKEHYEFKMDCYRVRFGIVSYEGCTRYDTKQEAKAAFEKMLDSWRDKKSKHLVKYISPDIELETDFLRRDIEQMVECNCSKCGKQTVHKNEFSILAVECNDCNNKRRKSEHEQRYIENMERRKQEEEKAKNPIERYVDEIRGKCQYWEVPFERSERLQIEHAADRYAKECCGTVLEARDEWIHQYNTKSESKFVHSFLQAHADEFMRTNDGRIPSELVEELKEKWNYIKHKKRKDIEERKQYERDSKFAFDNSPMHKYEYEILWKIGCQCRNEEMRQTGNVCKTC
jgi:hypothetical protein